MNPLNPGYFSSPELRELGFSRVGENVQIARNCVIVGQENIEIGDNVRIDAFTTIIAAGGSLKLGDFIHIGTSCLLGCRGGLEIHGFGGLSHGVKVFTASDDFSGNSMPSCCVPAEMSNVRISSIEIGKFCAIGANSVVLPGAHLREGSVLGALSMAVRPLREWYIHAGNPAKRIMERSREVAKLEAAAWGGSIEQRAA